VVVAGGPWNGKFMKKLGYNLPLQPTRHEVFVLKKSPGTPVTHPVIFDLIEMTYMREESPDLMLGGDIAKDEHTDPDDFDQGTTMAQTQRIWGRLSSLMPSLADAELFTSFSGLYTNTPDNLPILGKMEGVDGLYFVGGFNGYGFKLSPAVGITMAELITEGESKTVDISPLGPGRFAGVTA
jgi:sarcosine oxidase subunit beta